MSMEKIHMPELRDAIPDTPDMCRDVVLHAVSTYREEKEMRRTYKIVFAAALVLVLLCGTVALAAGWNVLQFLQLPEDHLSSGMVKDVSTSASTGQCSIQIDSVVTDGKFLAFDWTVQNNDVTRPVYIQVDKFTANGARLFTDGTDDFDQQWFPGMYNQGVMQDGNLTQLPEVIDSETVEMEMVVGVYTPKKPVYQLEVFDEKIIRQKQADGYYVIVAGEGLVMEHPEEGLVVGYGAINDKCADEFVRTEMIVQFDVDMSMSKDAIKSLVLPEARKENGVIMEYTAASISPLQVSCTMEMYEESMTWERACELLSQGYFELTDIEGNYLEHIPLEGSGGVREKADGTWCVYYDYSFANDESLPEKVSVSFMMDDGTVCLAPISIR